jgi:CheY-like chemotaxis protein
MSLDQKSKILCVEDEKDIRDNIVEILRDEGFEVFEADNGKRGFESFMQNKPDLVISDIMMPEVDGYALLQMIRESKNTRNNNVPFIFLTALGQKDNLVKGVSMSANDYLVKPIDFDVMIAKVKEKIANFSKVQEVNNRNIKNIKNQVSVLLPGEVFAYLDVISQITSVLKEEPYGPFPHRRYGEDLDKVYLNALKLRTAINNALDQDVIESRINTDEEVISVIGFFNDFISSLNDKLKSRINFEQPFEPESLPRVKIDRLVLLEALKKVLVGMLKSDPKASVTVSVMMDHKDNMVLIFYLNSDQKNIDLHANIDESQISKVLDKQTCRFEIVENRDLTTCLIIPSYRLIQQ